MSNEVKICKNCKKPLPENSPKQKRYCDDCSKQNHKTRQLKRYYDKKGMVSSSIKITWEQKKYIDDNYINIGKLLRGTIEGLMKNSKAKVIV